MPRVFGSVMHASDDQDQGYFDKAKVFISCLSNQLSPVIDRWLLWQRDTCYTLYIGLHCDGVLAAWLCTIFIYYMHAVSYIIIIIITIIVVSL